MLTIAQVSLVLLIAASSSVSALTCNRVGSHPNLVGGGFLNGTHFVTVEHYDLDETVSKIHFRRIDTGLDHGNPFIVPLGSVMAITCPARQLIGIALRNRYFDLDGVSIVQPYVYRNDGSELGHIRRTTKDTHWQMYFSPECTKLMVRSDDQKSQLYDTDSLYIGPTNNWYSPPDGNWMQMASENFAITGRGKIMRYLKLVGRPNQRKNAQVLDTFAVTGAVQSFAMSPSRQYIFVAGEMLRLPRAFKNLVSMFPKGRKIKVIDNDDNDLSAVHTAYSPLGTHFAGIFERSSGNVLKLYTTKGWSAVLVATELVGSSARHVYFSPDGQKLLVLGDKDAKELWLCDL